MSEVSLCLYHTTGRINFQSPHFEETRLTQDRFRRRLPLRLRAHSLQGYLAHMKMHSPRILQ